MISETGALEFFMFGSAVWNRRGSPNRNMRISNDLATITGYARLPPLHTLGFHFAKYDVASAEIIMERDANFTKEEFPVDVFWLDI